MPFRRGQLEKFVAVADAGQITRAASRLNLAQPALSHAIAQLESELGIALLERHPRSVTLTAAGNALLPKARAAVAAHTDAVLTARSLARAATGTLELGFLGSPPLLHVPDLIDAFTEMYPGVELCYRELPLPSGPIGSWIGEVDVALCHPPPMQSDVRVQRIRTERRVLIAPRSHPLAQRREVSVAEVVDETFLGYHPGVDPVWAGFWSLDDHRGEPASLLSADRVATSTEMLAALSSGNALTTVPAFQAEVIVNVVASLVAIPLSDADAADLSLVWNRDRESPLVRAMVSVAEALAHLDKSSGDGTVR